MNITFLNRSFQGWHWSYTSWVASFQTWEIPCLRWAAMHNYPGICCTYTYMDCGKEMLGIHVNQITIHACLHCRCWNAFAHRVPFYLWISWYVAAQFSRCLGDFWKSIHRIGVLLRRTDKNQHKQIYNVFLASTLKIARYTPRKFSVNTPTFPNLKVVAFSKPLFFSIPGINWGNFDQWMFFGG